MNGIIILNKPLGYTSRDIVNIVGKYFNTRKVGHTGTLDPNASGVIVLCVGKALKICELLMDHDKEYIAEIILGIKTDTLDTDLNASILEDVNVNIEDDKIKTVVNSFAGKYMQEIPIYSAVKVNGRKLYEYARNNISVDLPKKEVEIKDIELLSDIKHENGKVIFKIKTTVSKGTYIRGLVRDIGNKLGYPAVMNSLVRTKLGKFDIEDANSLDDIKNGNYKLYKITDVLDNIPVIKVDDNNAFKIKNGVSIDKLFNDNMSFIVDKYNNLLALYKNDDGKCRPYKMFV